MKTQIDEQTILDCGHPLDIGTPATIVEKGRTSVIQGWRWTFALDGKRKICHACQLEQTLDCGHKVSPHSCISTGYATNSDGRRICYECADMATREDMKDRSQPFAAYVSSDGRSITTWTGGKLADVIRSRTVCLTRQSFTHGRTIQSIKCRDVYGKLWFGKGNPGICIKLRPCAA